MFPPIEFILVVIPLKPSLAHNRKLSLFAMEAILNYGHLYV